MSEFKEVWYVWGGGDTPNNVKGLLFTDGEVMRISKGRFNTANYWLQGIDLPKGKKNDCIAYTLGQKRRRVECKVCHGIGSPITESPEGGIKFCFNDKCESCNGTGKVWEYSE